MVTVREVRRLWLVIVVAACAACGTVRVQVMGEEGRTGSYRMLFLTAAQKNEFNELEQKAPNLDDWINYSGKPTEQLFNKVEAKRQLYAAVGDENVTPFVTRGDSGIDEADYVLLFVTGGAPELSDSNRFLERRRKLVRWPYWFTGTITVSKEGIRIGSPAKEKEAR